LTLAQRHRMLARVKRRAGMTLVEASAIVCVAGVLVAVFVPTFARHLHTSKTAEASEQLAELHRLSAAYYAARHTGADGHVRQRCLPEAAGPAPALPTTDPVAVDFAAATTPGAATWSALGFAPADPTRYRYTLTPAMVGCDVTARGRAHVLVLTAEGDLDGDDVRSRFERRATVRGDDLVPTGVLIVSERVE
jgi:Tfp pilus assembly protein PilE